MSDDPRSRQARPTRRTALRSLVAATSVTPAGLGVASARSESERSHDGDGTPDPPYPNTTVRTYDDSLRRITSHPHLLALSEEAIDRHFDSSSLEGREFERARTYVRNLRSRYPVERVETDSEIVFRLRPEARRNLSIERRSARPLAETASRRGFRPSPADGGVPSQQSDADRDALRTAVGAFGDLAESRESFGQGLELQWVPSHHGRMLEAVAEDVGASGNFADWAERPDEFGELANGALGLADGTLEIPSVVPFGIREDVVERTLGRALQRVVRIALDNYAQFYHPADLRIPTPAIDDLRIGNAGMAPQAARYFAEEAKRHDGGSDDNRRNAAFASHYVQDVGNPLHTGAVVEQAGVVWDVGVDTWYGVPTGIDVDVDTTSPNRWLHHGYERLVRDRWDDLQDHLAGTYTPSIDDAADAVRSVAAETHRYADDLFHTIYENEGHARSADPAAWSAETRREALRAISNCLDVTGRYNRALLVDVGIGEASSA